MKFGQRQNLSGLLVMWLVALLAAAPFSSTFADDTPAGSAGKTTVLRGRASWYGREHQGLRTSSGERFDRFKYTCAHKTLPFGTRLRVTNPKNGKSVVVRVSDRGPYRHQRILDLSEIAARPLDLVRLGSAGVIAEIVPASTPLGPVEGTATLPADTEAEDVAAATAEAPEPAETYVVQAGTFGDARNAEAVAAKIQALEGQLPVAVQPSTTPEGRPVSRVIVGARMERPAAEDLRRRLQQRGIDGLVRQAENL